MSNTKGKAVFVRVASRPIPRVLRMMNVASELGYATIFCGAFREQRLDVNDTYDGQTVVRVGVYWPLLGGRGSGLYLRSVFRYNVALYRYLRATRPTLVHASDFETAPASILYRVRRGGRLVYNIHDNLALRYRIPSLMAALLNLLEGLCVRASDAALVPEEFRKTALPRWCRSKVAVVHNTIEDAGISPAPVSDEKIRIFFGGWLDWGRGLRQLIELVEHAHDFELVVAGEGAVDVVAALERHTRVRYLGFIAHRDVIEQTRRSHVVAALYDPSRVINRFAAPNKVAEACCVGRPVLLNPETEISREPMMRQCSVLVPYDEIPGAGEKVRELVRDRRAYGAACMAARRVYEERYAWEPVRQAIRNVLIGEETA